MKTYIIKNGGANVEEGCELARCHADWLSWSPRDPNLLATVYSEARSDPSVEVWNAATGECIHRVPIPASGCCVEWGPEFIAATDKNDKLHVIDTRTWAVKSSDATEANQLAWDPTGTFLFLANRDGSLTIYRTKTTNTAAAPAQQSLNWAEEGPLRTFEAVPSQIVGFSFDRSGKHFLLVTNDSNFSVWRTNELICLHSFACFDVGTPAAAFCGDGLIVAGCNKSMIRRSEPFRVFSVETGRLLGSTDNDTRASCFAFCQEQKVLACIPDEDKKVLTLYTIK